MLRSIGLFIALFLLPLIADAVEVRPEINGTMDTACLTDSDETACAFGTAAAVPSNIYNSLVSTARSTSYITIQDLTLADSAGMGLRPGGDSDHTQILNLEIGPVGSNAIDVQPGSRQTYIANNTAHHANTCTYKLRNNPDTSLPAPCRGSWGSIIELGGTAGGDAYTIAENNDAYLAYGEGISVNGANYTWMVGNRVRGTRQTAMFVDNGANHLMESNITWDYDTTAVMGAVVGNAWWDDPDRGAAGVQEYNNVSFSHTIEPRSFCGGATCDSSNNIVRNNIVAGSSLTSTGVHANNKTSIGSPPNPNVNNTQPLGVAYWGNTILGNMDLDGGVDQDPQKGSLEIENNIVQGTSSGANCEALSATNYSPHAMAEQLWRVSPTDTHCDGSGDEYGEAALATDVDLFGESAWTEASGPTLSDVILDDAAAGDDTGADLNGAAVSWLVAAEWDYFSSVSYPHSPNATNWAYKLYYDFDGTARSNTPNKGVDETN